MKGLIFGAGNIGRGFLGLLLAESGFDVTFVDVDENRVRAINQKGSYPVYLVGGKTTEEKIVSGVRAVSARDDDGLTREIVKADLILTAVGKRALLKVAPSLGHGLEARLKTRPRDQMHVVVVACENVHDNTSYLAEAMFGHMADETREALQDVVSFPNCMVDRIVPNIADPQISSLAVWVEDYCRLAVDALNLQGPFPQMKGVELVANLGALLEQKLFTLNMAHAITGYFGWIAGYQFVHEAVDDCEIKSLLDGALHEVGELLCERHPNILAEDQKRFAKTTVERFGNSRLQDKLSRVTSDPKRKLGHDDRLIKPALLITEMGRSPSYLSAGAAATLNYRNPDDLEAEALRQELIGVKAEVVVGETYGIDPSNSLARSIASHYLLRQL
jgi:mannitol-1-phosphate 5-dehydrogenase